MTPSPTRSPDTAADRRGARIGAVAAALCEFKAFLAAKSQRLPRAAVDVLTQVNECARTLAMPALFSIHSFDFSSNDKSSIHVEYQR